MMTDPEWEIFKNVFTDNISEYEIFSASLVSFFDKHKSLAVAGRKVVHSIKHRIKDVNHLREKIDRKNINQVRITPENLLSEVTDIAGIRVILLSQIDFSVVHQSIMRKVDASEWALNEAPKAYTWDPEAKKFFESFNLGVEVKDSSYTSVHYLIKPRQDSHICCELQVRSLFEEIWGEVDHLINYPTPSKDLACKEQLMVLSKIVGAGSRLVDSIYRTTNLAPKNDAGG